ncbi:hypothetical protein LTR78_009939 [Recurvomyces mirabilis]|uniref:Uncharacterized protein n=1 Tax=Recurvomyces mirabilis TaxID=574656 RepID=A0AAE0TN09_9PEZI|nr:hypothetical protein LTR78_009939 [Recurvomyces mirabilis]KAK5160371.1 hypothetical protein LTS14_001383 [Recurvomyces mirabilis]
MARMPPCSKARLLKMELERRVFQPTATLKIFGIVELLEAILQNLDLRTLHPFRRGNSIFKSIIESSPTLRPIAPGHNDPSACEVLRHRLLRICPEGSTVFVTHPLVGVLFGMTVHISTLTLGQIERVHGMWEDILLHATSGHLECWFRRLENAATMKLRLGSSITLGGLINMVVDDIQKGGDRFSGYRVEVDLEGLAL